MTAPTTMSGCQRRPCQVQTGEHRQLSPISEVIPQLASVRVGSPAPKASPSTPNASVTAASEPPKTMTEENRSLLLSDLPQNDLQSLRSSVSTPPSISVIAETRSREDRENQLPSSAQIDSKHLNPSGYLVDRRLSDTTVRPSSLGLSFTNPADRRRSEALSSRRSPPSAEQVREMHKQLLAWWRTYFNSPGTADIFVHAVSFSHIPPSTSTPPASLGAHHSAVSMDHTGSDASPTGKTTIRALVRPCNRGREPFILKRDFDIDALRSTIPEVPLPGDDSDSDTSSRRSSMSEGVDLRALKLAFQRRANTNPVSWRRESRSGGVLPSPPTSPTCARGRARAAHRRRCQREGVAIHLEYARIFLPIIAAFLYSGHVKTGDLIDLPMPHPEVWKQTVSYLYGGQCELTESMKENIRYLAGNA
ncbi:hypothetical protein MKZ38_010434 [Zalerion maritima]|uniref:Uncharacterized protein n=1 Tax=Zalerion maritima TaxID=339359 RepID=A0AAD5WUI0_9PEZI|nr:hypothetical protein MKZ38_010434 [Zalerion maritima]